MNTDIFEIERKFLIRYPDCEWLFANSDVTEITQTYLLRPDPSRSARVRKRGRDGNYVYTHTVKQRISDMRRIEIEREISEEEYEELLKQADPKRNVIHKLRCCLPFRGQMFELDLFPFWTDRAILEIELKEESQPVEFPPELEILREVTGDRRYTNSSMAKEIPQDFL